MSGQGEKGERYAFSEPLTAEEARCLLAHLPDYPVGRWLNHKNPVLASALRKLDWQKDHPA